jgi:hypothetical protein
MSMIRNKKMDKVLFTGWLFAKTLEQPFVG